jgi:FkbM family methyltransferase
MVLAYKADHTPAGGGRSSCGPKLGVGMEIAASELDQYAMIWGDCDPLRIVPMAGVHAESGKNGVAIEFSGSFRPWGYAASIRIPEALQKSGNIAFRAVIEVFEGTIGIGVTDVRDTEFLAQKLVGPGCHFVAIEVASPQPVGPIVLRHASAKAGSSAFVLHLLQFPLVAGEVGAGIGQSRTRSRADLPFHPVFTKIPRWTGSVGPGMTANWLGTVTRSIYNNNNSAPPGRVLTPYVPTVDDEYFEWIDLLESVLEADDKFTMVELGAGWGRWLVDAWRALKQVGQTDREFLLVGVEAEPTHFAWMKQHFADNGLDVRRHRLIQAAVAANDGVANFMIGHAEAWYGQAIVSGIGDQFNNWPEASVKKVATVSLATVLKDIPLVDLIDMDIQGAEADVVEASRDLLDRRVKRVHIGTHGGDIEARLRTAFVGMGWRCHYDFAHGGKATTPFGVVSFGDGVQSWLNPRYARPAR